MTQKLCYHIIDKRIMEETTESAKKCERKRKNYNLHNLEDNVQRMLNAIEPDSYVRPHRHYDPPKIESFVVLKGSVTIIIFDQNGNIIDCVLLEADNKNSNGNVGIDIKPGIWHSLISNESGSIVFEVKDGPYIPATDKDFALWAPAEGDESVGEFLTELKRKVQQFYQSMFHVKH